MSWQLQEESTEKSRLLQEINSLQLKNAQLVEDHTRDVLAIKSKETQLIRAHSDLDSVRMQVTQLEHEAERSRSRPLSLSTSNQRSSIYQRITSPTSPTKSQIPSFESPRRFQKHSQQYSSASNFSANSIGSQDSAIAGTEEMDIDIEEPPAMSHRPMSYQEPKVNQFEGHPRYNSIRNSYHGGNLSSIPSYRRTVDDTADGTFYSGSNGVNDWQRAAETTEKLKVRIEAMRARSTQRPQHER